MPTWMFLELPVELRLRIAEYALEKHPTAGLPIHNQLCDNCDYQAFRNLALLLVNRQFNQDFKAVAYNKTRFTLWSEKMIARMLEFPPRKVRNIRRIALYAYKDGLACWERMYRDIGQLHLDRLIILWPEVWGCGINTGDLVLLLRRLRSIKTVKFISWSRKRSLNLSGYFSSNGAIMKEDQFQRYDTPDAPKIGTTWWNSHLDAERYIITLNAQAPRPVFSKEDYMLLM